jgi:hypothetical protein
MVPAYALVVTSETALRVQLVSAKPNTSWYRNTDPNRASYVPMLSGDSGRCTAGLGILRVLLPSSANALPSMSTFYGRGRAALSFPPGVVVASKPPSLAVKVLVVPPSQRPISRANIGFTSTLVSSQGGHKCFGPMTITRCSQMLPH